MGGAEGIGNWQHVFETIGYLGVTINIGVAVMHLEPMRSLPFWQQAMAFFAMEKALMSGRSIIAIFIPEEPSDVTRIEDFNAVVVRQLSQKFKAKQNTQYEKDEQCKYTQQNSRDLLWQLSADNMSDSEREIDLALEPQKREKDSEDEDGSGDEAQARQSCLTGDTDPFGFLL